MVGIAESCTNLGLRLFDDLRLDREDRVGARAVQIVHSSRKGSRDIEHLGSVHDDVELELLKTVARQRLAARQGELDLELDARPEAGRLLPITASRIGHLWNALSVAYDRLGFAERLAAMSCHRRHRCHRSSLTRVNPAHRRGQPGDGGVTARCSLYSPSLILRHCVTMAETGAREGTHPSVQPREKSGRRSCSCIATNPWSDRRRPTS